MNRPTDREEVIFAIRLPERSAYLKRICTEDPAFGPDHPSTLSSMLSLGNIYTREKRLAEAEVLLRQTVDVAQKSLGLAHPKTLVAMGDLARVYDLDGKYDEAAALDLQTIEIEKDTFGPDHPNRLIAMSNLSIVYRKQGKLDRAEALQVEALESEKRVLGVNHLSTLAAMRGLATLQVQEGKFAAAEPILRSVIGVYAESAPDDWRKYSAMSLLGEALNGLNRAAEAEPLLLEGHDGLKRTSETIPKETRTVVLKSAERILAFYTKTEQPAKVTEWTQILATERAAFGAK